VKLVYVVVAMLICGCGGAATKYNPELVGEFEDINSYDSPPVLLTAAVPEYPEMALDVGAEGKVVLKLLVLEDGSVGKIQVVEASNPILVDEAIEAAAKCVFAPARKGGKPCCATTLLPIIFDKDAKGTRIRRSLETTGSLMFLDSKDDSPSEGSKP